MKNFVKTCFLILLNVVFCVFRKIIDSKILNSEMKKVFFKLCQFDSSVKFNLLYRATRDGFRAVNFHSKCDNKSATITIVQTDRGFVFGGYTSLTWNDQNNNGIIFYF